MLDIGTGTGILAVMAARVGAAHVYACEVNGVLCDIAREVLERCAPTLSPPTVPTRLLATVAQRFHYADLLHKYNLPPPRPLGTSYLPFHTPKAGARDGPF